MNRENFPQKGSIAFLTLCWSAILGYFPQNEAVYCLMFIVSLQTTLAMNMHLTMALVCLRKWVFPYCLAFECNRMLLLPLLVWVYLPLRQAVMVAGCTGHKDLLCHTTPSEHQELVWNYSLEQFFSLLSGARYPVFSDVFLLDTHLQSWNRTKVLSLQHRVGPFLMIGYLLASV